MAESAQIIPIAGWKPPEDAKDAELIRLRRIAARASSFIGLRDVVKESKGLYETSEDAAVRIKNYIFEGSDD